MGKLGDKIRDARNRKKMSQASLAKKLGVDSQTISNLETGKTKSLMLKSLELLPGLLGIDLVDEDDANTGQIQSWLTTVPTFDLPERPRASHWSELVGAEDLTNENDPRITDQGLFRVRIHGDCMEPRWHDGELIEFKIWRQGGEPMPIGEDVALTNSDGQTTFKTLVRFDEDDADGVIVLRARNQKKYPKEMRVPMQMLARMAVALHVIQKRPV
jgi:transcriptional regulator with XRE-family HTH domain